MKSNRGQGSDEGKWHEWKVLNWKKDMMEKKGVTGDDLRVLELLPCQLINMCWPSKIISKPVPAVLFNQDTEKVFSFHARIMQQLLVHVMLQALMTAVYLLKHRAPPVLLIITILGEACCILCISSLKPPFLCFHSSPLFESIRCILKSTHIPPLYCHIGAPLFGSCAQLWLWAII